MYRSTIEILIDVQVGTRVFRSKQAQAAKIDEYKGDFLSMFS